MIKHIKNRLLAVGALVCVLIFMSTGYASAHVVVKPGEVTTASYETFTVGVPNEKDIAVTGVRLVIPSGITSVTPTVKQGWEVTTSRSGDAITEISWAGGRIDAGLRDDFTFSAKTPNQPSELTWKAYQAYEDGSVVSWDQKPAEDHSHNSEDESKGPYSITVVSSDIENNQAMDANTASSKVSLVLSGIAVILSIFVIARTLRS